MYGNVERTLKKGVLKYQFLWDDIPLYYLPVGITSLVSGWYDATYPLPLRTKG